MDVKKQMILTALHKFAAQRPGLEFGNYGDIAAYRSEMRGITRDLNQARTLLRAIEWRDSITGDSILEACAHAFSGRLTLIQCTEDAQTISHFEVQYCTGQYWPTEYRRAVCAVASAVLWTWLRDTSMPTPTLMHNSETGENVERYDGLRAGDWLRKKFRSEFGRAIGNRWFS